MHFFDGGAHDVDFRLLLANAQSPAFRVDPYWPKPLPNKWILGQVGGIYVDAQDNIWVFQRPRSLTDDEKAAALDPPRAKCCVPAPSVLEFNQSGDVVKSWGGPGDNLGYDWPLQEHGILVDGNGFVWLSGNGKGDNMVLKFTIDGKFIKQIGKSGPLTSSTDLGQFGQVAALELDKDQNEIYAADGYGNHRVVVLDADTGSIKRVWGAYGKPPTDDNLSVYDADSPQFANPVHCIALSKDGLVFVCDRANNRVQVFRKDGSFVRQYVFDPNTRGPGSSWGLAFSPLDKTQNFFVLVDQRNAGNGPPQGRPRRWQFRPSRTQCRRVPLPARRQVRLAWQSLYRRGRYREAPAEMGAGRVRRRSYMCRERPATAPSAAPCRIVRISTARP
jgi:NHL repeat